MSSARVVVVVAACLGGIACERGWDAPADTAAIAVDREHLVVRTGNVGAGEFERVSTYVLATARNRSDRDLLVTLRGDLLDGGQRRELLPESLRVPAGGERVFALVDRGQVARPDARGAEVVVSGALAISYAPSITVTDGHVYQDQGRAVVAARITNTGKVEATVPVIAAFFGADGLPVQRPFTVVKLTGGGQRSVQLVGPPGSTSAQMYAGEAQF